jgi:hypothetical protein
MDWSAKPNTLINPPVSATDFGSARWNGSEVVALTVEDLAAEDNASRTAQWQSRTVSYFNNKSQRTNDRL